MIHLKLNKASTVSQLVLILAELQKTMCKSASTQVLPLALLKIQRGKRSITLWNKLDGANRTRI